MKKQSNSLFYAVAVILAVAFITTSSIIIYLLATSNKVEPEKGSVVITNRVTFIDPNAKFNLEREGDTTTLSYALNSFNEVGYLYANISATLPESCYRYNEIYFKFSVKGIKSVVFVIGDTPYYVDGLKDDDVKTVSFKISDWGQIPKIFVYPDTYNSSLSSCYAANKQMSVSEIGFYTAKE